MSEQTKSGASSVATPRDQRRSASAWQQRVYHMRGHHLDMGSLIEIGRIILTIGDAFVFLILMLAN